MLHAAIASRFRPEALFHPRSVAVLGASTPLGRSILANLQGFGGTVMAGEAVADLPAAPDLAVIATDPAAIVPALAARGTFAAICASQADALPRGSCRVLGPASFGVIVPALGLNASTSHLQPRPGRLALVSQSAALCRAVLDWAEPNGVGFSHVVGTGANTDVGFALILDWLSRDPGTGAILLDIRSIRDRRAFLSAARAAARLRPVVAIRAGGRLHDPSGREDLVFDAALRRAGVLRVSRLADLLAAAETLTRSRPARSEVLAIATNAVGPGQMGADEAVRLGIPLATPDAAAQTVLGLHLPPQPREPGLVWTGADHPTRVAEAAAMWSALPEVGGVVAVLAPTGAGDAAGVAALAASLPAMRIPLLACILGETTGAESRRRLADAGVPTFASPEQAVHGFAQLVERRRAAAAARELPSSRVLSVAADLDSARAALRRAAPSGVLRPDAAAAVFAAYGLPGALHPALRIEVADDAMFGPSIALHVAAWPGQPAIDLPPLNLSLAAALVARGAAAQVLDEAGRDAAADALVRVSQMVVDLPELAGLRLGAGDAAIALRPPGSRSALAIPAYPAELAEAWAAGPDMLSIRPIRPEDAEAHGAFFRRLSPDDVRYRFFAALRSLPPEQLARMTQVDYDREMAFVAVRDSTAETVGVSRLVREPPGGSAEFAVVVDPGMKGRGLARHLMQRLIGWGRDQGVTEIVGQVLADNAPMLGFMRHIGFTIRRIPGEADVVEAALTL